MMRARIPSAFQKFPCAQHAGNGAAIANDSDVGAGIVEEIRFANPEGIIFVKNLLNATAASAQVSGASILQNLAANRRAGGRVGRDSDDHIGHAAHDADILQSLMRHTLDIAGEAGQAADDLHVKIGIADKRANLLGNAHGGKKAHM